jgi:3-hydroxyacyl-CoA dehydrogenase
VGLATVLERVRQLGRNRHGDPAFWTPAPLLERLAKEGRRFESS